MGQFFILGLKLTCLIFYFADFPIENTLESIILYIVAALIVKVDILDIYKGFIKVFDIQFSDDTRIRMAKSKHEFSSNRLVPAHFNTIIQSFVI